MATFVLVHGAWHGGWCWRDVVRFLREAGHDVFAPTLTGLGDRFHLAELGVVDLSTHITDVVNLLRFEELEKVRLVGHSYGGNVISGVAEVAEAQIDHLVYLDAIVPVHGKSHVEMVPARAGGAADQLKKAGKEAASLPVAGMGFLGVTRESDVAWLRRRLVPHPMASLTERSNLPADRAAALPRTFIYCTQREGPPSAFARAAREDPAWRYRELDTGHDAMVTAPRALTDLLLELA